MIVKLYADALHFNTKFMYLIQVKPVSVGNQKLAQIQCKQTTKNHQGTVRDKTGNKIDKTINNTII